LSNTLRNQKTLLGYVCAKGPENSHTSRQNFCRRRLGMDIRLQWPPCLVLGQGRV